MKYVLTSIFAMLRLPSKFRLLAEDTPMIWHCIMVDRIDSISNIFIHLNSFMRKDIKLAQVQSIRVLE